MFDDELLGDLQAAVQRFRAGERRRLFSPTLHVGSLTGASVSWSEDATVALDAGLRTDVVLGLLSRVSLEGDQRPAVWLTRVGAPLPHDEDLAWSGPVHRALDAAGSRPRCVVVVTKTGWYEPRGEQRRHWRRPRLRSR